MKLNVQQLRARIKEALPEGSVVAEHTSKGHFYRINTPDTNGNVGNIYPSVTGKLQILKDESLMNYKMNQAIQYVFRHFREFTDTNIMEHLDFASRAPIDVLIDAGGVGDVVHKTREAYFRTWILQNSDPGDPRGWLPEGSEVDPRIISALRALSAFIKDYDYEPIATELFVYSHGLKVAGTLDDIGLFTEITNKGDSDCLHDEIGTVKDTTVCLKCGRRGRRRLILLDIKTSNQFKDHYFFQVSLYRQMFYALTGIKPEVCLILKLSKEDGTYKIEELREPPKLAMYAKYMLKTNEGMDFIRSIRKDNQKVVGDTVVL